MFVSHWLETFGDERWTWTPEQCDLPALLARNTVNGAALVRRSAFDAVGGYSEDMREGCEDWDFWLRLVEAGFHGTIIPEVLFYYRRRPDSMSREMLEAQAYRRPLEMLVARHAPAYRAHLTTVLVAKEAETLHLTHEIADLERDRLAILEPALRRAREELDAVSQKAQRVKTIRVREEEPGAAGVEGRRARAPGRCSARVVEWRITAPLRKLYAFLGAGR